KLPRIILTPFRSARDLFLSRRKNSELSAGKANVTAIIAQSAAIVFWRSIGKARGPLSPLPFQGRGQGEGSLRAYPMSNTPHLNPLPFTKGERRISGKHVDAGQFGFDDSSTICTTKLFFSVVAAGVDRGSCDAAAVAVAGDVEPDAPPID